MKSGGRQGERIYSKFIYLLNPRQVFDISKDGPEPGLVEMLRRGGRRYEDCLQPSTFQVDKTQYSRVRRRRLFRLGAECDGCVGGRARGGQVVCRLNTPTLLDTIDYGGNRPPVAVLPLGTGNDLARQLNWGGGYDSQPLHEILASIEKSSQVGLFVDGRFAVAISFQRPPHLTRFEDFVGSMANKNRADKKLRSQRFAAKLQFE